LCGGPFRSGARATNTWRSSSWRLHRRIVSCGYMGVHSHMIVDEEADYEALVELIEAEDPMGSLI